MAGSDARERLRVFFERGEHRGLTQAQIGRRLGLSDSRVSRLIREMDLPYSRGDGRGGPRDAGIRRRLRELFDDGWAGGRTHAQIAEKLGVSRPRVSRLVRELGVGGREG